MERITGVRVNNNHDPANHPLTTPEDPVITHNGHPVREEKSVVPELDKSKFPACTSLPSSPLSRRTPQVRYAPASVSAEEEEFLASELDVNVVLEDGDETVNLLSQNPWLVLKLPERLKNIFFPGTHSETLMHIICRLPDCKSAVINAFDTREGQELLTSRNYLNRTPIHNLTLKQSGEVLRKCLEKGVNKNVFLETDSQNETPLHYAASTPDSEAACFEFIMDYCPDSLLVKNSDGESPFTILLSYNTVPVKKKIKLLEKASQLKGFTELLYETPRSVTYCLAIEKKIRQLTKHLEKPTWPLALDVEAMKAEREKQSVFDQTVRQKLPAEPEYSRNFPGLDLASSVNNQCRIKDSVKVFVKGLKQLGVYGQFQCFDHEAPDSLYSLGDANSCIQMVRKLAALGVSSIQLRLSPPDNRSKDNRSVLPNVQKVILQKLNLLLSDTNFSPQKGLPQTITLGSCSVRIIDAYSPAINEPQLELGFVAPKKRNFLLTETRPLNYISLLPYRYRHYSLAIHTDIHTSCESSTGTPQIQSVRVPLNLPSNCIMQKTEAEKPAFGQQLKSEQKWITDELAKVSYNNPVLAECLADICSRCRRSHLFMGIIYGIHHGKVHNYSSEIIKRWLHVLNKRVEKTDVPVMLCLHKSRISPHLNEYLSKSHVPMIELNNQEQLKGKVDVLSDCKDVTVCLLPELPQPVFHHLLTTSSLPALVEGANLTSYLLETGHPYLSLLPEGHTPIPYDMGYPLEALKAEAFSYKLRLNQEQQDLLHTLTDLIENGDFNSASAFLTDYSNFVVLHEIKFLHTPSDSLDASGNKKVTIRGLIQKGIEGRLGSLEKEALLSAVNPSIDTMAQYTDDCLDEHSVTRDHFTMQQKHVNQRFNDAVVMALYKFAQVKKVRF